jgi:hypothetical protein
MNFMIILDYVQKKEIFYPKGKIRFHAMVMVFMPHYILIH